MRMKKTVLAIVVLLSFAIMASANDITTVYKTVMEKVDSTDVSVISMDAICNKNINGEMTIEVYKATETKFDETTVKYIYQGTADQNGKVNFKFSLPEAGNYKAIISTGSLKTPVDFTYKISTEINSTISSINTANDKSQISSIIDENKNVFGFDMSLYEPINKALVEEKLFSDKQNITANNLSDKFQKASLLSYIQVQKDATKTENAIAKYDGIYYSLKDDCAASIYQSFSGFKDSNKKLTYTQMQGKNYNEYADVANCFNQAVTVTALKTLDKNAIVKFIDLNNSYLKLDGYQGETLDEKNRVATELIKNASNINTIEQLKSAYAIIRSNKPINNNPTPSGGGGGGGGGYTPSGEGVSPIDPNNSQTSDKENKIFTDMNDASWAEPAIKYLFDKKIITGYEDNKFYPNNNITRAEFAKIITTAFDLYDENATCDFSDVPKEEWYYTYVASLFSQGIINGQSDDIFGVTSDITREDMAAILYRVLVKQNKMEKTPTIIHCFSDEDSISRYALNSVLMLGNVKILSGNEEGKFMPKDNATRAEVSQMIYNVLNKNN